MIWQIPPPPDLGLSWPALPAIVCGSLVAAALLLLWGRRVDRCLLALAGAGAGLALAGPLARWTAMPPLAARISAAATMAILAFILARVVWAAIAGGAFGLAAVCLLAEQVSATDPRGWPTFAAGADNLQAYCGALWQFGLACIGYLWARAPGLLAAAGGLGAGVPVLVCLLRPRLGRFFMSSLLGAAGVVLAAGCMIALLAPSRAALVWRSWPLAVAVGGLLMTLGIVNQYRGALAADRARACRRREPGQKGRSKPSPSAEKN